MDVRMNERIRELWDEAAKSAAAYPSGENNSWQTQVDFVEKFAQLIVRECADLCDRFQARDVGMQPAECAGAIRKMFGVEE